MVPPPKENSKKKHNNNHQPRSPKKNEEQPHEREDEVEETQENNINVKELLARIENLEKTVVELKSELSIVKNVNTKLTTELDDLHQYQRRSCVLIEGINADANENEDQIKAKVKNVMTHNLGLDEEEFQREFDKCHRVGPIKDDGQQTTIVRFKSHRFRENVYRHRNTTTNHKIKIKLSLTRTRTKTLNYAHKITEENKQNINFAFSDPNGNLKFQLRRPVNGRSVISFITIDDIEELIDKNDWNRPGYETDQDSENED